MRTAMRRLPIRKLRFSSCPVWSARHQVLQRRRDAAALQATAEVTGCG
jgi:hypothetical protein